MSVPFVIPHQRKISSATKGSNRICCFIAADLTTCDYQVTLACVTCTPQTCPPSRCSGDLRVPQAWARNRHPSSPQSTCPLAPFRETPQEILGCLFISRDVMVPCSARPIPHGYGEQIWLHRKGFFPTQPDSSPVIAGNGSVRAAKSFSLPSQTCPF